MGQGDGHAPSRRGFLLGGALSLVTGAALAQEQAKPAAPLTGDDALRRLLEGNERYRANTPLQRDFRQLRQQSATGEAPFAAIVGGSDARVPPEICFDQGPNDLYVIRNAGGLVDVATIASMEYAVLELHVPLILVLGHTDSPLIKAAVKAANGNLSLPGHLSQLILPILPAVENVRSSGEDMVAAVTNANVEENAMRIWASEPILAPAITSGRVKLASAVFDVESGTVTVL